MIVGVSDEGMATLEKWVKAKNVTFPIVNAPKGLSTYGVTAYPTVYVVDAAGKVASKGKPSDDQIGKGLQAVTWRPSFGDTPLLKALTGLWKNGKLADLDKKLKQAEGDAKLADEDKRGVEVVRSLLQKLEERTQKEIEEAAVGPDYVAIEDRLRDIEKQWSGLPTADAAKKAAADLRKDKRIRGELDAGRKLRDILRTGDDIKKLTPALQALIKRFPDSFAASQARDLLRAR